MTLQHRPNIVCIPSLQHFAAKLRSSMATLTVSAAVTIGIGAGMSTYMPGAWASDAPAQDSKASAASGCPMHAGGMAGGGAGGMAGGMRPGPMHPGGMPPGGMCRGGMHGAAHAGSPRINLEHQAQQEVSNDMAIITLFAEFKDKEASAASQRASIATQQALARLQSDAAVLERRSSLQTWNDYGADGKVAGWRSRAEIVIEGKDFAGLGKAASRLSSDFAYSGVAYRLSHEARQREEQALMTRAIAAWRDKAQTVVSALGYGSGFEAVDVTVRTSSDSGMGGPQMRMAQPMMMAASAEGAPAAALEGGRSKVTVTVSGAVRAK